MLDKKYDFKSVEEGKYETWLKYGYFKCGDKSKKPFCLVIPPPNVTGNLHIGHAFDTSLQDIIVRYKRMCGYDTLYLPGMDHAAIATESKVVNKLKNEGINKYELGREEFLNECWKWKNEHADNIHKQWAKLGLSVDYDKERFTLDEGLNKAVTKVFIDYYNKGLIYRGEKIINWDPVAMTALSNEEVIYEEEKGKLYYLKYKFVGSDEYILVATTRPETIYGDIAVAVNPNSEKYKNVIGKKVIVPLVNREVLIIADERVLLDFGTGALKITPAHAMDDFEIGKDHNLEIINTINPNGTLNELAGDYNGLSVSEARDKIVKDLYKLNLISDEEDYVHSIGRSERTGAVVEPYLSKQWFVKMDKLAKNILEKQKSNEKIEFFPKRFENELNRWMENCHDWCISRQLWWGHRIPAWYKDDEVIVSSECPGEGWHQDEDVLDTWFSSALWPFSTLGWPNETEDLQRYFPTDVLVTGYDIIFFWVARMSFQSLELTNEVPFKNCLIHGLIRDKLGRKMSKSLGNGVDPIEMIDKYGCDALRFYLTTSCAPGADLNFDEEKLASTWNFINKLWNASRYVIMNLENFNERDYNFDNLSITDKWILDESNNLIKKVTESMNKYRFNDVGSYIYDFTWGMFCDWYIELSKKQLDKNTTKSVLLYVLTTIVKILHPFMPFVTEEIYSYLPIKDESIMISEYPTMNKEFNFKSEKELINKVIENITNIRNFKVENNITKNSMVEIECDDVIKQIFIDSLKLDINKELDKTKCELLEYKSSLVKLNFYFENELDNEALKLSLLKEKENLEQSIEKRRTLLSNESYITKAPSHIVEMDRVKLKEEEEKLIIINEKIDKLN